MVRCTVCNRSFNNLAALNSHLDSTGHRRGGKPPASHVPRRRNGRVGFVPPPPIQPAPSAIPPPNTQRLTVSQNILGTTTADFQAYAFTLSGTNPSAIPDSVKAIPSLGSTAVIRNIEIEYVGKLTSNLRWAAIISDTAPRSDATILAKMWQNGAIGSHDSKAMFMALKVPGPPLTADPTKPRVLYLCIERGVHADTSSACDFTIHVDVAGNTIAGDYVSL